MPNETVVIEAVDQEKKAAKINGEWKPVGGKAAEFIKYLKPGEAEVGITAGVITYARTKKAEGEARSSTSTGYARDPAKDARITRQWAVREAIVLLRLWAELGGGSLEHKEGMTLAQYEWSNRKELYEAIMTTADALENSITIREDADAS